MRKPASPRYLHSHHAGSVFPRSLTALPLSGVHVFLQKAVSLLLSSFILKIFPFYLPCLSDICITGLKQHLGSLVSPARLNPSILFNGTIRLPQEILQRMPSLQGCILLPSFCPLCFRLTLREHCTFCPMPHTTPSSLHLVGWFH